MHKILSLGGKCESCGNHIEFRVLSQLEEHRHWLYSLTGFICGGLITHLF
jgi:hypothetical protein